MELSCSVCAKIMEEILESMSHAKSSLDMFERRRMFRIKPWLKLRIIMLCANSSIKDSFKRRRNLKNNSLSISMLRHPILTNQSHCDYREMLWNKVILTK